MDNKLPTCGQLERDLSQSIQQLYLKELKHSPSKVTCQLFGNQLAIVIDNALTAIERTLVQKQGSVDTVTKLNSAINESIKQKLKTVIEGTLEVEVKDILFNSALHTYRTGAIATLSQSPQVRNPESIPKNKSY